MNGMRVLEVRRHSLVRDHVHLSQEGIALVRQGGATARLGQTQAEAWQAIAQALPAGGRALVISHGRIIEAGAVTCFPDAGHAAWGAPFGKCEGLRLLHAHGAWAAPELLRLPDCLT